MHFYYDCSHVFLTEKKIKKYIVKLPLSEWNKKSNIFLFCQKYDCFYYNSIYC